MNWDDLEKELSKEQETQQYLVDTEKLWKNIESHIPKEKNKKRLVMFWLFGAVITIPLLTWQYTKYKSSTKSNYSKEIDSISDIVWKEVKIALSPHKNLKNQYSIDTDATSNQIDHSTKIGIEHSFKNSSFVTKPKFIDELEPFSLGHEKISKATRTEYGLSEHFGFDNSIEPVEKQNEYADKDDFNQYSKLKHSSNILVINKIKPLTLPPLEINIGQAFIPELGKNQSQFFKAYKNKSLWYVEVGTMLSTGHGMLALKSGDWEDNFRNRSSAEESLLSYGFQIMVGTEILPRWNLKTGLRNHHLFKRSTSTLYSSRTLSLDNALLQEIFTSNGSQQIRGSVDIQQQITKIAQRIITYRLLEVPIEATYTHFIGSLLLDFGGGVAGTLSYNKTGFIHPSSSQEYDLSTDELQWYRRSTLWSANILAGLRIPISRHFDIYSRGRYQHYMTPVTTNNYGVSESLSGYHLEFGLRISL